MLRATALTFALCLATVTAHAALLSRAGGQAYYDTDTNLTWVADANLAQTSGYDADGKMTWNQALDWIASLNAQNAGLGYLSMNDWRLPTVTDTGLSGCDNAFTGTDCGYNVDLATGEMARMYYGTMGNTGLYDTSGVATGCSIFGFPLFCLADSGPFSNLQGYYDYYWYGTSYVSPDSSLAWMFSFSSGHQWFETKTFDGRYAWAVRSGDIIPIPPAAWLFASALGVMGWLRRQQSNV